MRSRNSGFTIVELLVVIAIIGILIALLMPAIQSAREAGRQNTCQSNLKQLGQAASQHVDSFGRYPSNGWGTAWVGDPDCGTGPGQPGGWVFNVLPYIDQQALHDLGASGSSQVNPATNAPFTKTAASALRITTPLPLLTCASRRRNNAIPTNPAASTFPYFTDSTTLPMARTDYAINLGDGSAGGTGYSQYVGICQNPTIAGGPGPTGPAKPSSGDARQVSANWFNTDPPATAPGTLVSAWTGVSFTQSTIQPAQVQDGSGYVFLIGEKSLDPDYYLTGGDPGDSENMFVGMDNDIGRIASASFKLAPDTPGVSSPCGFGSAHLNGTYFVFCDGSCRVLHYGVNPQLFQNLANRSDGAPIDDAMLR